MLIKTIQTELLSDSIRQAALQSGQVLEVDEIEAKLEEVLETLRVRTLGEPFIKYRLPHPAIISSSENQDVWARLEFDLEVAYRALRLIKERADLTPYFRILKKLHTQFKSLLRTDQLVEAITEVDLTKDIDYHTTTASYINGVWTLPFTPRGHSRQVSYTASRDVSNYFTLEEGETVELGLDKLYKISLVTIDVLYGNIIVKWSNDGYNFYTMNGGDGIWQELIDAKAFKIEASEPTKLGNIALWTAAYASEADLITLPISIDQPIDLFSIHVDGYDPRGAIQYYYTFTSPWAGGDWTPITPDEPVQVNDITRATTTFGSSSTWGTYSTGARTLYTSPAISAELAWKIGSEPITVQRGPNQAAITYYAYDWEHTEAPLVASQILHDMRGAFPPPNNAQPVWEGLTDISTGSGGIIYLDSGMHRIRINNSGGLQRDTSKDNTYHIRIVVKTDRESTPTFDVPVSLPDDTYVQIYCNGALVAANDSTSLNYVFNAGINIIDVYVILMAGTATTGQIPLGFDLSPSSDDWVDYGITGVYADPTPMKLVSLNELAYMVSSRDTSHFSLTYDADDHPMIVLPYDPTATHTLDGTNTSDVEQFYVVYAEASAGITHSLWLKAHFVYNEGDPVPTIERIVVSAGD